MFSKNKKVDRLLTFNLPVTLMLVWTVFPIYWTLNTAFKPEGDILKIPVQYFPTNFTFANFVNAWENVGFEIYFKNSIIVGLGTVVFTVILSILAGYALARYDFKGKRAFMMTLLGTQFIPRPMLVIPLFLIFSKLGLISN